MSHQPTHNVHPGQHRLCPTRQVAVRRLKPTVFMTNHPPATSGATNPADPHHHVTTQTSEEPPNDETGRKAGQIDTTKGRAYKVRRRSFILFLFTTDYCNSTMTRGNLPRPRHPPQCQPQPMNPASQTNANTVGVIESHTVVHHYTTWCRRNTGVHALRPGYHSPDFPILARLHGSVN